jgi:hypothetical protein
MLKRHFCDLNFYWVSRMRDDREWPLLAHSGLTQPPRRMRDSFHMCGSAYLSGEASASSILSEP